MPAALQFCSGACACSFALMLIALAMPTLGGFIPMFALGEVALFSINAVASGAVLWSVPLRLRSLSMSLITIAIHVFGDVPSPPLIGALQDALNRRDATRERSNWRWSLRVVVMSLALACGLFAVAAGMAGRRERAAGAAGARGEEEAGLREAGGEEGEGGSEAATTPLLQTS